MKAFNKRLASALVTVGLLGGVTGCGTDNESEAQKLTKKEPDPGKALPGSTPDKIVAPPKTNAERAGRGAQGTVNAKGYPGKKN